MAARTENLKQHLVLSNRCAHEVDLWIEPWGDRIRLRPQASYHLVGTGPSGGFFEVELRNDDFAVYGWEGSTVEIFDGQHKLWGCPVAVPGTPAIVSEQL